MEEQKKSLVLIADDVPKNLQVIGSILMKEGYQIALANNGRQVLAMMDKILPDLILLDVMMPELDGFEVCKILKSSEKTKEIPIIFLTAKTESQDIVKGFEYGAVDYITKPFNTLELLVRVKNHVDLKRARDIQQKLIHNLQKANAAIEAANKKIMESLRYAKKIQRSLLPNMDEVKIRCPGTFAIWMPRDVVGGDIIFTDFFENGMIGAIIDCTGHGVPGAFMTMIASSGMRTIVKDEGCHDPAEILKRLNSFVKTTLQQDTSYALSDDGMDAAVVRVTTDPLKEIGQNPYPPSLTFAGARLPLIHIYNDEIHIIKGDKQSIGYKRSDLDFHFTNHTIPIEPKMSFYMLTDGYTDQLGGIKRLPFGKKRLKELLLNIWKEPFETQLQLLIQAFNDHKGENERQDDVTVVGFGF